MYNNYLLTLEFVFCELFVLGLAFQVLFVHSCFLSPLFLSLLDFVSCVGEHRQGRYSEMLAVTQR